MKIRIKNPAPLGPNLTKWGDYHFGQSLQAALERKGVTVRQDYWPNWSCGDDDSTILVLRGKRGYLPPPDFRSMMWVISHPATVTVEEVDSYDHVLVASDRHRRMLADTTQTPIDVMRQCTDTTIFTPTVSSDSGMDARRGIVFVANSRGVKRDMVRWAVDSGIRPRIHGRHWAGVGFGELVVSDYIPNPQLPEFYRSARLSLNDHWGDMAHFGVINNRIFDCLASGLPVLSDTFGELREVCGDSILHAGDAAEFADAIRQFTFEYPRLCEKTTELWQRIGRHYTFDARAEQIISMMDSPLPRARVSSGKAKVDEVDTGFLVQACREGGKQGEIKLLHVGPTPGHMRQLFAAEGVGYLSGGFGDGPWHVDIGRNLDQIQNRSLDLVVLDDPSGPAGDLELLLTKVCTKLSKGGSLALVPGAQCVWPRLELMGFQLISEDQGWMLYQLPERAEYMDAKTS